MEISLNEFRLSRFISVKSNSISNSLSSSNMNFTFSKESIYLRLLSFEAIGDPVSCPCLTRSYDETILSKMDCSRSFNVGLCAIEKN